MNISVFGLGYVGCVTSAVLTKQGHNVIGVDINPIKIDQINEGKSPIVEDQVDVLIEDAVSKGSLRATQNISDALSNSSLSLVCVGTPSNTDGSTNLKYVEKVAQEIAQLVAGKETRHTIIFRSTIPPSTMKKMITPIFESLPHVGVCFNPEFLREGHAVYDYYNPPYVVASVDCEETKSVVRELYNDISAEVIFTDFKTAELLKMVNNVFHALKVSFANEIGRFSELHDIDGKQVMDLVCKDTKLNISTKYLRPGSPFGGSCLPKDLRSFVYMARQKNITLPIIDNIITSNDQHVQHIQEKVRQHNTKNIGFTGLSFKQGTDDLRESPSVRLVEHFIGKGYNIKIYDPHVELAHLLGSNKEYIEKGIPHIHQLMCSTKEEVFEHADIIVNTRNEDLSGHITHHNVIDIR